MAESPELYPVILRTLVGSQAHGVADEGSDWDYREVFIAPTSHLLRIPKSQRPKLAWADEHRATDDEGGWEIESFLEMCLRSHPNAIELLRAPVEAITPDGDALRNLLPALVSRRAVSDSFLGYAKNARHKLLDKEQLSRNPKWAASYLRVLWVGQHLLTTGELVVDLTGREIRDAVLEARAGFMPPHRVIELADPWEAALLNGRAGPSALAEQPNLSAVNDWLLELRRRNW